MKRSAFLNLLGLLLQVSAAACSMVGTPAPSGAAAVENRPAGQIPEAVEASAVEDPTAGPAPVSPTATLEPFVFVYPSQVSAPESAWRPPLYPVPWAPTANDHFYFIRPIAANEVNWPDGSYRYGGIFFEDVVHTGVDIRAPEGTPVLAAGPGKIIWAGYGLYSGIAGPEDPYGLAVAIRHDFGFDGSTLYSLYAHLSQVDVIRGQLVETGQTIGLVGQTGFATGPHLHFEVRVAQNDFFTTFNPELWIAPPEGWGLLVGRIMGSSGQVLNHQEVTVTNLDTGQVWDTVTYGDMVSVNPDPYYRENLALGDLPAGRYEAATPYLGRVNRITFEIFPGQVTYFIFLGKDGFIFGAPEAVIPTPVPSPTP